MPKIALVFALCFALTCSVPLHKSFREAKSRKIRSLVDASEKEFQEYSPSVLDNTVPEDNIETNSSPSLFSANNFEKKHLFDLSVSNSKSNFGDEDWWLAGTGSYSFKPTGSKLFLKSNKTNSGLDIQADGTLNLKNNHSLFGKLNFGNNTRSGIFGYSHTPTGSEVSLKANRNDLGTDLSLVGKSNLFSNDKHSFKSLFTASKDFGSGTSSVGANFDYTHKPTGNNLSFGSKYSNEGLFLNGAGKWKFDDDHSLLGTVGARNVGGRWLGAGGLNYQHKPSDSNLQLGFGNNGEGNNLFLKGDTSFGSNNQHGLSATGVLTPGIGGSPDFGGTFGYHHKPSNSNFGIGFLNKQGNPQIAAQGGFNFKNGGKLGLGGHFSKGPGFSSSGFQISGAFK